MEFQEMEPEVVRSFARATVTTVSASSTGHSVELAISNPFDGLFDFGSVSRIIQTILIVIAIVLAVSLLPRFD